MDPLSVTAAIVGLLATGAKVSSSLWGFIGGVKQAPSMVYDLLDELHEIRTYLTQLQSLVPELELESRPRAALIMIDHVVITLTASVMNFSKLEEIVDSIVVTGEPINAHGRIRWVKKEQNIRVILHRLHSSNTSLHCMLTILTWWDYLELYIDYLFSNRCGVACPSSRHYPLRKNCQLRFSRLWRAIKIYRHGSRARERNQSSQAPEKGLQTL